MVLHENMPQIVLADITQLRVDAIVNAANASLAGGGGVDGAIHRAAGPRLLDACKPLAPCPTGQVRVTPGFALPCRYILHTVGPVWQGGGFDEATQLADCYRHCLARADELALARIAFPAISCGVYGYPAGPAAQIAIKTLCEYWPRAEQEAAQVEQIILVAYSWAMAEVLAQALREYIMQERK